MPHPTLRRLLHRAPRAPRRAHPPRVEELEPRALPTTLAPLTGFDPTLPPSASAGGASNALTSADGRFTVYTSTAANLVPGQVNTAVASNVFLYDRQTQITTLVSHVPGAANTGAEGNSLDPRVSSDGRFVVYQSDAPDLAAGQAGPRGYFNVFLYDLLTGANTLVSHRSDSPTTSGDDTSATAATTGFGFGAGSGRFLLFTSNATDLVAGQQGPAVANLFLYDTARGTVTLVSHNADPAHLTGGDDDTVAADLTPDGSAVVFESPATDIVPGQTPGHTDNVFLYQAATGNTRLVSGAFEGGANSPTDAAGSSAHPFISANGSEVTYVSAATDLVSGQTTGGGGRNVYAYATASGTTTLVSGAGGSAAVTGNADSPEAVLSSDGSTVAFASASTNLLPGQQNNPPPPPGTATGNVFLYTLASGKLTLASHAATNPATPAGGVSLSDGTTFADLSLSADGSLLAYLSTAGNLVTGQGGTAGVRNAFVYAAGPGQNELVSHVAGAPAQGGDQDTSFAHLSTDGSAVAFLSFATTLTPGLKVADGGQNLYVAGVTAGTGAVADPTLASRSASQATAVTLVRGTSADGTVVLFSSNDPTVVPGQADTNHDQDLFLLDRNTGTITLVSHVPGSPAAAGDRGSPAQVDGVQSFDAPVISADGNWVAFVSQATDLVPGETGEAGGRADQVYLFDNRPGPTRGTITLVSHDSGSAAAAGAGDSDSPALSADGRFLAFRSSAPDLVGGFTGPDVTNVYLYDTVTGTTTLVSHAGGRPLVGGDGPSSGPSVSDGNNGSCRVAYQSLADDLMAVGTVARVSNVYLYDSAAGRNVLVSHVASSTTTSPTVASTHPVISHDGSTVAFVSFAANLVPMQQPGPFTNVFLYDVAGTGLTLVSGMFGSATVPASSYSDSPALNDAGTRVAFRSDAPDLVVGQVNTPGSSTGVFLFGSSNVFLFDRPTGAVTLLSHAADAARTTAAGDSTAPALDGAGDLVVYLSTANDLVAGQQAGGVNSVFLYSVPLAANALVSGQDGPTFLPIISRDVVVAFNVLSGSRGASAPFLNTLARLVVSANAVPDGSPAGTVVGTLSIDSVFVGQFVPAIYGLPAVGDNAAFAVVGGQGPTALLLEVPASYAGKPSYLVTVRANFGFGNDFATFAVLVIQGQSHLPPGVRASLVPTKVKKKVRLMVEYFAADTGAAEGRFLSPFQAPTFRNIQVSVRNGRQVVLTARKGKRTLTRVVSV